MKDKDVMLTPVKKKNARTKYALYAVKHKRSYVLLNLSMANDIVAVQLENRCFSFLGKRKNYKREKMTDGYKCDIYIEDTCTIVEIKTVLSFGIAVVHMAVVLF